MSNKNRGAIIQFFQIITVAIQIHQRNKNPNKITILNAKLKFKSRYFYIQNSYNLRKNIRKTRFKGKTLKPSFFK